MRTTQNTKHRPHILVVGGGYVGMHAALRLQKKLRRGEATVTVVDPQPTMTYQPFLPEAAGGLIDARHVVVPLRRVLPRCRVLSGRVTRLAHDRRTATIQPPGGEPVELRYDVLVLAPGSVSQVLPVPGLDRAGIGFKTVGEAVHLRNQVLSRLDVAAAADEAQRGKALTFVFVGGGSAGVEALGELESMTREALKIYPELSPLAVRWVLVEAADRILPDMSVSLSDYTVTRLRRRGVEVRLRTRVESMVDGRLVLSDGCVLEADTVVCTTGVRANPLLAHSGLPVDREGRVLCSAALRVQGIDDVWAAGDCAAVPDLSRKDDPAALCAPTGQHAVRQARRLADNVVAVLRAKPPRPYRHADVGSVVSFGAHQGVAEVYGVRLRGLAAWAMHRGYHLMQVPTLGQRARITLDWMLALLFGRQVVSLPQVHHPRRDWEDAAHAAIPATPDRRPADRGPVLFDSAARHLDQHGGALADADAGSRDAQPTAAAG